MPHVVVDWEGLQFRCISEGIILQQLRERLELKRRGGKEAQRAGTGKPPRAGGWEWTRYVIEGMLDGMKKLA
jgi:hypothetical protein